jgi:GNAT superfamily N-acetyltransferase/predicted nucleotidyltransferase
MMATTFLSDLVNWARSEPRVGAIALVGSHARGTARADSDIDLVLLLDDPPSFLADTSWVHSFGQSWRQEVERWGKVMSLRVWYVDGREVEYGLTGLDWGSDPTDEGDMRVIRDGIRVLYERGAKLTTRLHDLVRVSLAETTREYECCFPVMLQLRPHLEQSAFLEQVHRQAQEENYHLAYVEHAGAVRAVAGFRLVHMLSRGRHIYVDDLVTESGERSKGYGALLFDWLVNYAKEQNCERLNLDSGVQRNAAHRFYFRQGMHITAYHFTLPLKDVS